MEKEDPIARMHEADDNALILLQRQRTLSSEEVELMTKQLEWRERIWPHHVGLNLERAFDSISPFLEVDDRKTDAETGNVEFYLVRRNAPSDHSKIVLTICWEPGSNISVEAKMGMERTHHSKRIPLFRDESAETMTAAIVEVVSRAYSRFIWD